VSTRRASYARGTARNLRAVRRAEIRHCRARAPRGGGAILDIAAIPPQRPFDRMLICQSIVHGLAIPVRIRSSPSIRCAALVTTALFSPETRSDPRTHRIAPLVVVPRDHLHQVVSQHLGQLRVTIELLGLCIMSVETPGLPCTPESFERTLAACFQFALTPRWLVDFDVEHHQVHHRTLGRRTASRKRPACL